LADERRVLGFLYGWGEVLPSFPHGSGNQSS
jgi:hypothetical protein